MKKDKDIATSLEVLEQLEKVNFELLFKDLVTFANNKMKGNNIVEAEKIVGDVFEKVANGVRKWNKAITFKQFLFRSVRSLVSQYNNQYGGKIKDLNYDYEFDKLIDIPNNNSQKLEELINKVTEKLYSHIPPPDENEKKIFECWIEEITKPKEIREFWSMNKKDYENAVRRLERKLNPIRELLNSSNNE